MSIRLKQKLYPDEKAAVSAASEIRACMYSPKRWKIITYKTTTSTGDKAWIGLAEMDALQVFESRTGAYVCRHAPNTTGPMGALTPEVSTHPADAVNRMVGQAARKVKHLLGVLKDGADHADEETRGMIDAAQQANQK